MRGPAIPIRVSPAQSRRHERQIPVHRRVLTPSERLASMKPSITRLLMLVSSIPARNLSSQGSLPLSPSCEALCFVSFNHWTTASSQTRFGPSPSLSRRHASAFSLSWSSCAWTLSSVSALRRMRRPLGVVPTETRSQALYGGRRLPPCDGAVGYRGAQAARERVLRQAEGKGTGRMACQVMLAE